MSKNDWASNSKHDFPVHDIKHNLVKQPDIDEEGKTAISDNDLSRSSIPSYLESIKTWIENQKKIAKFKVFGIFLILPSDVEVVSYLTDFGKEIDLLSGDECCILALGKKTSKNLNESLTQEEVINWKEITQTHVDSGRSICIGESFNLQFTDYPSLIIFKDLTSLKIAIVKLKGLNSQEISERMRKVFSIVKKSLNEDKDPVDELIKNQRLQVFIHHGKTIITEITGRAIEGIINALISQPHL